METAKEFNKIVNDFFVSRKMSKSDVLDILSSWVVAFLIDNKLSQADADDYYEECKSIYKEVLNEKNNS